MALGALTAACATDPQRDQEQNHAMDLLYESLFADRPFHLDCTDRWPGKPLPPGVHAWVTSSNQPPYTFSRLDTLNLPRAYVPAITLVSVPEASVNISIEGVAREDWELRLCAQGTGDSEEEARNYLNKVSMNRIGSLVTLDSGGFGPIPLTGGRGHLVVEAPAIAPVTIHNTFGAIAIHDMAGAVSLSSAHARVSILSTTGNVDASAFVIDFAGAKGAVMLNAVDDVNIKLTAPQFEGRLSASAQRTVRVFVPRGFKGPIEATVNQPKNFVCRADLCGKMQKKKNGGRYSFTYAGGGAAASNQISLSSEFANVVIDNAE
jgi:hypothetical protein